MRVCVTHPDSLPQMTLLPRAYDLYARLLRQKGSKARAHMLKRATLHQKLYLGLHLVAVTRKPPDTFSSHSFFSLLLLLTLQVYGEV